MTDYELATQKNHQIATILGWTEIKWSLWYEDDPNAGVYEQSGYVAVNPVSGESESLPRWIDMADDALRLLQYMNEHESNGDTIYVLSWHIEYGWYIEKQKDLGYDGTFFIDMATGKEPARVICEAFLQWHNEQEQANNDEN